MAEETLEGHGAVPIVVDLCPRCQAFWFDARESVRLTPRSTLALFRIIGEHTALPHAPGTGAVKCPRCRARLRPTRDMQRNTRFSYLRCPNGHGRLTTFFEFLKEKDFVRPLTPAQVQDLRRNIRQVNCSNCGASVDLARGTACGHCGSALSMLDMEQAGRLVAQLQKADRTGQPVDPALPLELERARRETEAAFTGFDHDTTWFRDAASSGLVGAGLHAVARWLRAQAIR